MKITTHNKPNNDKPSIKDLEYGDVFLKDSVPHIYCDYFTKIDSCRICNLITGDIGCIDGDEKVNKLECELKIYGVNNG